MADAQYPAAAVGNEDGGLALTHVKLTAALADLQAFGASGEDQLALDAIVVGAGEVFILMDYNLIVTTAFVSSAGALSASHLYLRDVDNGTQIGGSLNPMNVGANQDTQNPTSEVGFGADITKAMLPSPQTSGHFGLGFLLSQEPGTLTAGQADIHITYFIRPA